MNILNILWERVGKEMSERINSNGNVIKFNNLQKSDLGEYSCAATNEIGTTNLIINIYENNKTISYSIMQHKKRNMKLKLKNQKVKTIKNLLNNNQKTKNAISPVIKSTSEKIKSSQNDSRIVYKNLIQANLKDDINFVCPSSNKIKWYKKGEINRIISIKKRFIIKNITNNDFGTYACVIQADHQFITHEFKIIKSGNRNKLVFLLIIRFTYFFNN